MNYVVITLDTVKPNINIYTPAYTTQDIINTITIESNEKLSDYQEIYVIDSQNIRHDYTFNKVSDTQYVGNIKFNDLPLGVATLYAQMKDEVWNISDLVSESFHIVEKSKHLSHVEIKDSSALVSISESVPKIDISDSSNVEVITKDFKER